MDDSVTKQDTQWKSEWPYAQLNRVNKSVSEWSKKVNQWVSEKKWVDQWAIKSVGEWQYSKQLSKWMNQWISQWASEAESESLNQWISESLSERVQLSANHWISESLVIEQISEGVCVKQWASESVQEWISAWVNQCRSWIKLYDLNCRCFTPLFSLLYKRNSLKCCVLFILFIILENSVIPETFSDITLL